MKKIIVISLATIAIAAAALIAVPALAKGSPVPAQSSALTQAAPVVTTPAATDSLYAGYGATFCAGGLVLNDKVTLQRVVTTLGITYDQLVQRLQNGETIASIATSQKVDLSKVVDTIVAAQTDMVNVLVKYGYITQDQANTIIANLKTRVEAALSVSAPQAGSYYGYGCFGYGLNGTTTAPVTGYGYGMMGGRVGFGMMGW